MNYSLMQKKILESPNQFLINWQEIGEVDGKSRIILNWSLVKQDYGFMSCNCTTMIFRSLSTQNPLTVEISTIIEVESTIITF